MSIYAIMFYGLGAVIVAATVEPRVRQEQCAIPQHHNRRFAVARIARPRGADHHLNVVILSHAKTS